MEIEIKFDGEVLARVDVIGQDNPSTACEAVRRRLDIAALRPPKYKLDLTPNLRTLEAPEPVPMVYDPRPPLARG